MSATSQATIVFTDLVGFTQYNDARGDDAALKVLDEQSAVAMGALDGRGRLVKELGDGLMLWFAQPTEALQAGVDLVSGIEAARMERGFPLAVRVGMHTGAVVERGADFVGQTVNIASRIADLAGPGEILLSEQLVRSIDGTPPVEFHAVGPTRVKGVAAPIWLYRYDAASHRGPVAATRLPR